MQHGRAQIVARVLGNRRKAEMPGFGLNARQYSAKRTEKSEPCRIGLQPFGKRRVRAARRELLRRELYPVIGRRGMTIDEINIRTPVMATRSGESGPRQNRLDALDRGQ